MRRRSGRRALEEGRSALFVGVGVCVGDLVPLQRLLAHVPANSGLVFVVAVVPDGGTHRPSLLLDLARHASMPVVEPASGVRPQVDHVYVAAPGTLVALDGDTFEVTPSAEGSAEGPIDRLFRSLAMEKGERSVGIVFDGAGEDGVAGLRAIKEHGGLPLAHISDAAKYASMPQSAVQARLVDHVPVLAPNQLATKLLEHAGCEASTRSIPRRKRANAALRESAARLHLFIEHAPAALAMFDRQMRYLSASRRWLSDYGLGGRDLYGLSHYEVFPEVSEAWKQVHRRAMNGEVVRADADRFVRADGGVQWLRCEARPWREASGAIGGIVIFSEEITPLVQANERVRESEQWLQMALEVAGAGTWQWNLRTNESIWSDGMWTLYGLEKGSRAPSFDAWREAVVLEDRERAVRTVNAAAQNGRNLTVEFRVRQADGNVHHLLARAQPVFDDSGRPEKYIGVVLDITERKRAEETTSRLAAIVEDSDDAILARDLDGTILTWNKGAERMFGYSAEEAVGTRAAMLIPPELRPEEDAVLARIAAGERVEHYETVRVTKAGVRRSVSVTISPLRCAEGTVIGSSKILRDITQRKRIEDALRLTQTSVDAASEMVAWFTTDGGVRYANNATCLALGYSREELMNLTALDLAPSLTWERHAEYWREVRERKSLTLEIAHRRKDGSEYPAEVTLNHVVHGGEEYILAFGRNITDRKRSEEALRASEERLALALRSARSGSFDWDIKTNVSLWSDELLALYGLTRAEFGGRYKDWIACIIPEDREAAAAALHRSLETGEFDLEFRIRRRDTGELRWMYGRGETFFDEQHRPTRMVGIGADVTDRREAEDAVKRSREGLARLASASLSVMGKTDLREMLQAVSEAALALTDARIATCGHGLVTGQLVVGGSARTPGAPACLSEKMFRLEKGGVHMELVDGAESIRLTDAELRAHPKWWGLPEGHVPMRGLLGARLLARSGKTNGVILVTDKEGGDFTAEDEVLLRQLGTVGSLALQHVEARMGLEEADRRKNEFLAMLSHELRNPLAPIRNSLYVLEHAKPGGEQARRAHSIIERQVGHLTRLVDDLLDVTRISRGKIRLQRERLDLCDLVRRAVEDYREAFAKGRLALELSLPEDALWVSADRTRVAQVIGNLLGNSAKFTPPGGKAMVSVERSEALGQAVVTVRDTGIGISPEMMPRVFEPFAQADSTLDRSRGGLGLGLAMVKGLVEMHGGTTSVESAGLGKGARFIVRLPMETTAPRAETSARRRDLDEGLRRVLVIEDNVDAAESLREVLELDGHAVEVGFSGAEGLELAGRFGPDVVLCDIGLPGMDGYDVARAMRRDPALRGARLVALSGYAAPEDIARARDAGFDAHLAKPPNLGKLVELLKKSGPGDGSRSRTAPSR